MHSVSGSTNSVTWPLASHTSRARITEESRPTMSSRSVTIARHHWRLMLFFSSAERAVVPGSPQAAVDLAGRVDEPPSLAQADDGVEAVTAQCHGAGLHPAGGRRARIPW